MRFSLNLMVVGFVAFSVPIHLAAAECITPSLLSRIFQSNTSGYQLPECTEEQIQQRAALTADSTYFETQSDDSMYRESTPRLATRAVAGNFGIVEGQQVFVSEGGNDPKNVDGMPVLPGHRSVSGAK